MAGSSELSSMGNNLASCCPSLALLVLGNECIELEWSVPPVPAPVLWPFLSAEQCIECFLLSLSAECHQDGNWSKIQAEHWQSSSPFGVTAVFFHVALEGNYDHLSFNVTIHMYQIHKDES